MNARDLEMHPVLMPHARLKIDPIDGHPILLFPEGMLVLNSTAHEIVRRCDGQTSVADLLRTLSEEFEESEDVLLHDLLENLDQLRERNLIVFKP